MENRSFLSIISSVPSYAHGLKVLLVHNDTLVHHQLEIYASEVSFRVTVTDEAKAAVSMICNGEESQFYLVMAKDDMPDMDTLSFLHFMFQNYIPVIFISSAEYSDVKCKALAKGSCLFLEEPILLEDLKYVWQHVYHTQVNLAKKTDQQTCCVSKVHGTLNDRKFVGKEKRKRLEMNFDSNHLTTFMEEDEDTAEREQNYDEFSEKMPRIVWTQELHQKFLDAINVLSERNNVRPKAILEQMNVPNLTARQISSHLQKYRTQESINQQVCISGFTSSPFQSQGYPGMPISIAALVGGSQNQNQCSMIFIETQESDMPQMDEFPRALNNHGSQNLEAEVGQPKPDASMDQNQPTREYDDPMKMLEEDCEEQDYSQNGLLSYQIDQYCEMLRNTLFRNNRPHDPQDLDI